VDKSENTPCEANSSLNNLLMADMYNNIVFNTDIMDLVFF